MDLLGDLLDNDYLVYKLINHDKKEIYYGITNDFDDRFNKHRNDDVVATKMWVFSSDNIDRKIVDDGLIKSKASDKAHNLADGNIRDMVRYSDYEIIDTGGW